MTQNTNAVGIITEYNPFHNGHAYQIQKAKELSGADTAVAIMSGFFTQRGLPAMLDVHTRAQMALSGGIDLVLLLPLPFACHNAGVFATGAVGILAQSHAINSISFGMEEIPQNLTELVHILAQETPQFKEKLHQHLDQGLSYTASRAKAAENLLPGSEQTLSQPNSALAIAYMIEALKKNYHLKFHPIKRIGSGYHATDSNNYSSATGIRKALTENRLQDAQNAMPQPSANLLQQALSDKRTLLNYDKLWTTLKILLARTPPEKIKTHSQMDEGIENRFLKLYKTSASFQDLVEKSTCRRYSRGRIQRQLLHFLLGLTHQDNIQYQRQGPSYIHPLAMNEKGRSLMKTINQNSTLKIAHRLCDLQNDPYGKKMWQLEEQASFIWETLLPDGALPPDKINFTLKP